METWSDERYLEERVEHQINWYDTKSLEKQAMYKRLKLTELSAAVTIPLLSGYLDSAPGLGVAVGVLGFIVALIAGVLGVLKYHELWIEYRSTCEALKHEKYLYLTGAAPYEGPNRFGVLVERVESLVSKEHATWVAHLSADPGKKEEKHAETKPNL